MDIRELRIGNHVLYNEERLEVGGILGSLVGLIIKESEEKDKRVNLIEVSDESLEPIPITEELLKELGFGVTGRYSNEFIHYIDKFGLFVKHVNGTNRFRLTIEDEDGIAYGNMLCHHLHELENFVYLTTKKELI